MTVMNGLFEESPALTSETYKLIKSISRVMAVNAPSGYQLVLEAQLRAGLIALNLHKPNPRFMRKPQSLPHWKEKLAKELLLSGMCRNIAIEEVARACSLSRSHFSRAFKFSTGVSPKDWANTMRMKRAQELMGDPSKSISDISLELGFSDQSHFSRTFARHFGASPKAWRSKSASATDQSSQPLIC